MSPTARQAPHCQAAARPPRLRDSDLATEPAMSVSGRPVSLPSPPSATPTTTVSVEHLVTHPETILAILRQAQHDAGESEGGTLAPQTIELDESDDGTLTLATSQPLARRQRYISVIRTPAVGVKSTGGVKSPRPSHQWSSASMPTSSACGRGLIRIPH